MSAFLEESGLSRIFQALYQFWRTDSCQAATSIIGTVVVLVLLIRIVLLLVALVRPSNLSTYRHCESGSWALVTGASDGIGRAFSAELLSRGFNVLLHGRNEKKLEMVKRELLELHPKRAIEIVVADASKQVRCIEVPDNVKWLTCQLKQDDSYKNVTQKVEQLPGKLTVLVNNVSQLRSEAFDLYPKLRARRAQDLS